jgi:putative glutamine amidotransferase
MPIAADIVGEPPPLVGLPCCTRITRDLPAHWVGEKYIFAVADAAGAVPLLLPALGDRIAAEALIARLDGLLLTGSPSNVEPHHYDGPPSAPGTLHDPARDALTLPLIRAAIAADVPMLAICRGIQELNAALGGTLHQLVHEIAGRLDHRAPRGEPAQRYAYTAHTVQLVPGGVLARLAGAAEVTVNSLHSQGIDRLAPDLAIEATAPDGQIEAVRHRQAAFVLGVQWHPEYGVREVAFSHALFAAFGAACRARARQRSGGMGLVRPSTGSG